MKHIVIILFFAACARPSPPIATAADAQRANIALADLESGRTLLLGKCAECHPTPMPTEQTRAEWPATLDIMAPRAKLDATQRTLIQNYLLTMAQQ